MFNHAIPTSVIEENILSSAIPRRERRSELEVRFYARPPRDKHSANRARVHSTARYRPASCG